MKPCNFHFEIKILDAALVSCIEVDKVLAKIYCRIFKRFFCEKQILCSHIIFHSDSILCTMFKPIISVLFLNYLQYTAKTARQAIFAP